MHACVLQGLFPLQSARSGTHNRTQIYDAVNTAFLETKWNRGASNRFFSSTALGSFLGKYFSNLAIFQDMSNHGVHTVLLRARKRIIQRCTVFLAKIWFQNRIPFSLCMSSQRKADCNISNQALRNNTHNVGTGNHKDHGLISIICTQWICYKIWNFFNVDQFQKSM